MAYTMTFRRLYIWLACSLIEPSSQTQWIAFFLFLETIFPAHETTFETVYFGTLHHSPFMAKTNIPALIDLPWHKSISNYNYVMYVASKARGGQSL
jgi:hypothetical protein